MKNWDASAPYFADVIRAYVSAYCTPALVKTRNGNTVLVNWCSSSNQFVDVITHAVWSSNGLHPVSASLDLYEFHWPLKGVAA